MKIVKFIAVAAALVLVGKLVADAGGVQPFLDTVLGASVDGVIILGVAVAAFFALRSRLGAAMKTLLPLIFAGLLLWIGSSVGGDLGNLLSIIAVLMAIGAFLSGRARNADKRAARKREADRRAWERWKAKDEAAFHSYQARKHAGTYFGHQAANRAKAARDRARR